MKGNQKVNSNSGRKFHINLISNQNFINDRSEFEESKQREIREAEQEEIKVNLANEIAQPIIEVAA